MSCSAADIRPRPGTTRRRRRVGLALAVALCAVAGLAGTASADVSTQVFTDKAGDSLAAPDLLSTQITYIENDAGSASDDQILFTSVLDKGGLGARFAPGDFVIWYLDTDNNASTGGPGAVPGSSPIGAESRIVLFGPATAGGVPDVELSRWNGSGFTFVRDLTSSEVVISEALGIVGLQVPRADIGAARGSTLALVEASTTSGQTDPDFAPDTPPRYTLAIPAAPGAPGVAPVATPGVPGTTALTLHAGVDPRGLPTTFRFQYGASAQYGSETTSGSAGAGDGQRHRHRDDHRADAGDHLQLPRDRHERGGVDDRSQPDGDHLQPRAQREDIGRDGHRHTHGHDRGHRRHPGQPGDGLLHLGPHRRRPLVAHDGAAGDGRQPERASLAERPAAQPPLPLPAGGRGRRRARRGRDPELRRAPHARARRRGGGHRPRDRDAHVAERASPPPCARSASRPGSP